MAGRGATPPTSEFANLTVHEESYNPEALSPNAMMVDQPEEHVIDATASERDDLAIINPDNLENGHDNAALTVASDCTSERRHTPAWLTF
jgi:ubiquitin carboxyl-terminal hydrolase 7